MLPIEFFLRAADRFPNRVALVKGQEALTYRELRARVLVCAARLVAIDPQPQSRVGVCMDNSIEHVVALLGVLASGKIWIPLSPRHGNLELTRIVSFTEPTILVEDVANVGRIKLPTATVVTAEALANRIECDLSQSEAGRAADPPCERICLPLEATQAIKFTGGTTGAPKGVIQSYRSWNVGIVTQLACFGWTCMDRYLVAAPLTHGSSAFMLPILSQGGCLVFPPETKPGAILDLIAEHGITALFMPPTLIYAVLAEQKREPREIGSIRFLIYSAAPMRIEKIAEAQEVFGPVMATTYGQTEAPLIATFMGPQDFKDPILMASVGQPTLLTDVAVFDPDGRRLSFGSTGEIAIRGDLVMSGYWRMPELTGETIRDGWLFTGDIGVFDEQGYLFLKDRVRDVIISGGFNVYPADVENVLGRHPAVYDCAVLGIPDEKWGEAVHAAVQLRPSASATEQELISFVKSELDSVKTPKSVHILEELPRNSVGKLVKGEIVREIRAALEKRAHAGSRPGQEPRQHP